MTRSEKWLLGGLALSLAVNGLLLALVMFEPDHHSGRHRGPDVRIGRLEQHLQPESRAVLREAVDSRRDALDREFQALRDARDGIAEALEKEPFDRAALEAAFADVERRQDAVRATVQAGFIDAASRLPVEERVKLARGGERYMRRMFGPRRDGERRGGRDRDGHPPESGR
ncbi:MAG: periplasmic heavy metal sensor [Sphingomonadales bacterium]